MTATCVLPDPFHVERDDARYIAEGVLEFVRAGGKPIALWLDPSGVVMVSMNGKTPGGDTSPFSLVGVYNARAFVQQIVDDILAMQREPINGRNATA